MAHTWFVIDENGRHALRRGQRDFWKMSEYTGPDIEWPEFTQLVVRSNRDNVAKALRTLARTRGWICEEVTSRPDSWDGGVVVVQNGVALCLSEPGVDLEERRLDPDFAEGIAGLLACDAAYFGHDESVGLIHVSRFDLGAPQLAWFDSIQPGPSYARTFHRAGTCTDEDPRVFALRALGLPDSSPLLDRYAFVDHVIQEVGCERLEPELSDLAVVGVFQLRDES